MAVIDKKSLQHLVKLARLDLTAAESKKLLFDLQKILDYFEELKTVATGRVEPMTGGHQLKNIFREDTIDLERRALTVSDPGKIIEAFPKSERGFNKVPKIFKS